jgi:hypothetical protein
MMAGTATRMAGEEEAHDQVMLWRHDATDLRYAHQGVDESMWKIAKAALPGGWRLEHLLLERHSP